MRGEGVVRVGSGSEDLSRGFLGGTEEGSARRTESVCGDSVYLARIKGSVVDKYPQHAYFPFVLNPVIPKRIYRLNSLGRRSTIPVGGRPERALPGAAYRRVSSGGTCARVTR